LSISSKIAVVALILKLVYFFGALIKLIIFLKIISLLSIFYGTIITLYQTKILRLLAYGGIVHIGYILLPICYFEDCGIDAFVYSINYLLIYIILSLTIFSILIYLNNLLIKQKARKLVYISDFGELKNSALAFILALSFLSMAGIPPFAGFFAKFYIFMLMAQSGDYISLLFICIFSIISCVYYLRLINFLFFDKKILHQLWNLIKPNSEIYFILFFKDLFFQFCLKLLRLFFNKYKMYVCRKKLLD
jgi:NADH-quinone oxidoreductase subunit N